jgi:tetratricopeptide (TPR) repeat protein
MLPAQLFHQAVDLERQNRLSEAETLYRTILKAIPNNFESLHNLGLIRMRQGKPEDAIRFFRKALNQKPNSPEASGNLGNAYLALNRLEDAVARYEKVIALRPDIPVTFNNLGAALQGLGRLEDSIAAYRRAIELRPDYVEAFSGLANTFLLDGHLREAIGYCEKALAIKPDDADAQWNQSLARLALGDFALGWRQYESRWNRATSGLRRREAPQWNGDSLLSGKTILLHAEQGVGDTLQFVRYASLVGQRGAEILLEVQESLSPLLKSLPFVSRVTVPTEQPGRFDYHCPLMSLPLAFGTTIETIPSLVPYVAAPAERSDRWRRELRYEGQTVVGLVWAGNPIHRNDRARSLPLKCLSPILKLPGVRFVALQKPLRDGDAELLSTINNVVSLGHRLADFSDTAAVISALDLVITVDTAVAHLAGAMGRPVWLLLAHSADWRWLQDRLDSPWYPTARLFRQRSRNDWSAVVDEVVQALGALATAP